MKRTGTIVKVAVFTLLVAGFATPAFADDREKRVDFRSSVRRVVEAQPLIPKAAPARNPYKGAAIGLMTGGLALAVYGFTHTTGAEAKMNETSVSVKETKATGIGVAGIAVAALGGVVYVAGERKASRMQPQISFSLNRAMVGGKVKW